MKCIPLPLDPPPELRLTFGAIAQSSQRQTVTYSADGAQPLCELIDPLLKNNGELQLSFALAKYLGNKGTWKASLAEGARYQAMIAGAPGTIMVPAPWPHVFQATVTVQSDPVPHQVIRYRPIGRLAFNLPCTPAIDVAWFETALSLYLDPNAIRSWPSSAETASLLLRPTA